MFSRSITGGGGGGHPVVTAGTTDSSCPVQASREALVQVRGKRTGELDRGVPGGVGIRDSHRDPGSGATEQTRVVAAVAEGDHPGERRLLETARQEAGQAGRLARADRDDAAASAFRRDAERAA